VKFGVVMELESVVGATQTYKQNETGERNFVDIHARESLPAVCGQTV
jgi:hypothetical protein